MGYTDHSLYDTTPNFDASDPYSWEIVPVAGNTTITSRQYRTRVEFIIPLLISCAIGVFAVLAGALASVMSHGPDVLGYVSSLARDNPFVPLPTGGSILGGADRTRAMDGLIIRLGDVNEGLKVGHIAVAEEERAGPLDTRKIFS